ncbi:hypothetical protein LCGC14_1892030 [marine sediment metagenome]|uniref:Uncharacterized protein n=1 Tax=marine sediment metagenome TaxID=412755 RepID=A0A0F9ID08_9ZZZZ
MSQTECGCMCHFDEFPRYATIDRVIICEDCKSEPCETVLMEQRMEAKDAKT